MDTKFDTPTTDECVREQLQTKDRCRRSQRIADYVNGCTPSSSLVNLSEKRCARNIETPSSTSASGALDQFQINYQVSELQNKYEHYLKS